MESNLRTEIEKILANAELGSDPLLPLSDAEIESIYRRAVGGYVPAPSVEEEARSQAGLREIAAAEAVCLIAATFGIAYYPVGLSMGLSILAAVAVAAIVGVLLRRGVAGPLSAAYYVTQRNNLIDRGFVPGRRFDPADPGVLSVVVDHLTEAPILRSEALCRSIEEQRFHISRSMGELRGVLVSLESELRSPVQDASTLLIESKRDAARDCIRRLRALDSDLQNQSADSRAAVKPLMELATRFARMAQASRSLERIQATHGLVEETEAVLEQNRLHLQALQSVASKAAEKLRDIEQIVKAHEAAKAEISTLYKPAGRTLRPSSAFSKM